MRRVGRWWIAAALVWVAIDIALNLALDMRNPLEVPLLAFANACLIRCGYWFGRARQYTVMMARLVGNLQQRGTSAGSVADEGDGT